MTKKRRLSMAQKRSLTGWAFLSVASLLIIVMSFYPLVRAFLLSLQTGIGVNLQRANPVYVNFQRVFIDTHFRQTIFNTFFYLIVQVPIMLMLALVLASMLNSPGLKFKGVFRTAIFLPCAVGLVAYAVIFRQMFMNFGLINTILVNLGIFETNYNFLGNAWSARFVIVIGLLWRWTGFNMVFYLAGLQNIDRSIYEAAEIDGANALQRFFSITIPQLRPIILLTAILSTNGTLQMVDESMNLTLGGPGIATRTMSHHIFVTAFEGAPNFGYAAAMSFVIFVFVAVLALIQMKVGDKR